KEAQPVDAATLIVAEDGDEIARKDRGRDRGEALEERRELREGWRRREIERVAERGELGERRGRDVLLGVARGQEIGDALAVARQEIARERRPSAVFERDQIETVAP